MKTELIPAYDREDEIIKLFTEYTDMLVKTDPVFVKYLDLQGYGDEVRDLDKKYGLPDGRLYLALLNGKSAGCVALRRLNDTECYNDSPVETTLFMKLDL